MFPLRHAAVLAAVLAVPAICGTAGASADPSCTYDPPTHQVTITGDPLFDDAQLRTTVLSDGAPATLEYDAEGFGGIYGSYCDGVLLSEVQRVVATGPGSLRFVASFLPFAPGTQLSADGFDSVGYVAPGDRPATITAGSAGVDVDGDGRPDLTIGSAPVLAITGSYQDDTISARGGGRTGRQLPAGVGFVVRPTPTTATSNAGHDVVLGHDGADAVDVTTAASADVETFKGDDGLIGGSRSGPYLLDGGAGNDTFMLKTGAVALGGAGDDTFLALNGASDVINGGGGQDTARIDAGDLVRSVENVTTS
jgi:hypothetical protein